MERTGTNISSNDLLYGILLILNYGCACRLRIDQYRNPAIPPSTKPKGPVMKMPNSGPWLACGVKMIGPKNPAEKPMPPKRTAPINMLEINP